MGGGIIIHWGYVHKLKIKSTSSRADEHEDTLQLNVIENSAYTRTLVQVLEEVVRHDVIHVIKTRHRKI